MESQYVPKEPYIAKCVKRGTTFDFVYIIFYPMRIQKFFCQVLENHVTPISSTNLAYQDSDTEDKDIIFSIIKPLAPGEGTLESVSHPFTPIARFSQEDINNNRILYRPPAKELGAQEREFFFTFTGIYSSKNESNVKTFVNRRIESFLCCYSVRWISE